MGSEHYYLGDNSMRMAFLKALGRKQKAKR
jgi:hypothetical protein